MLPLISSMVWGYGAGSAVYAAHLFGKGDNGGAVNASKVAAIISTAFSAFTVTLYYIARFRNIFKKLGFSLKGVQFSKEGIRENLKYSFPNMLQQSVMYLSSTFVSPLVNKVGTPALAGYTAAMKIYDVNAAIYQNSNKTITNYVAHCYGAKKYSMLSRGIVTGIVMTMCYLSFVLVPTVFAPEFTAGLFFGKSANTQSMEYAVFFLKYCMPFVVFNVINNAFHGIFRGSGSGRHLVISTLVYAVSRTVYSYALFPYYRIYAIFMSVALSWVTEAVFGSIIYFSGIWKTKEHKKIIKQ